MSKQSEFLANYRCSATTHGECDCPKCQGMDDAKTLPYDCARCKPDNPTDKCRECLRWVCLPGQVFGPRTAYVMVKAPGESGCSYVEKYDECT